MQPQHPQNHPSTRPGRPEPSAPPRSAPRPSPGAKAVGEPEGASAAPESRVTFRNCGQLAFHHPNRRGDGRALRFELKLPDIPWEAGFLFMEMAHQNPTERDRNRSFATFDWERKVTVKLGFIDVCEILAVLEGEQEQAGGDRGLYHAAPGMNTLIGCRRSADLAGVWIDVSRKSERDGQGFKGTFLLRPTEALGLRHVLRQGLFHLAFPGTVATPGPGPAGQGASPTTVRPARTGRDAGGRLSDAA